MYTCINFVHYIHCSWATEMYDTGTCINSVSYTVCVCGGGRVMGGSLKNLEKRYPDAT